MARNRNHVLARRCFLFWGFNRLIRHIACCTLGIGSMYGVFSLRRCPRKICARARSMSPFVLHNSCCCWSTRSVGWLCDGRHVARRRIIIIFAQRNRTKHGRRARQEVIECDLARLIINYAIAKSRLTVNPSFSEPSSIVQNLQTLDKNREEHREAGDPRH